MAKRKESIYKSWDEIDSQLKRLGELSIEKSKIDAKLTLIENKLKERNAVIVKEIATETTKIKKEIARFCEQNKEIFLNKRSKKLNFGSIAYRMSEKVVIADDKAAIKSLKNLNLDFCLRIKEEIDKEEVKKLDPQTLTKIGIRIEKEDKLSIEPNMIEIAALIN